MSVLGSDLRKRLENVCVAGRREADAACRAVLEPWDVWGDRPSAFLNDEQRLLRRGLRARSRQLGDTQRSIELLVAECAYEQWHRLLFARFLAENRLLIHPDFGAPVSLEECEELAESLGERDGWSVAARFAAEILPGIFRLDDPALQLRLTPDGLARLEGLVESLPADLFVADDALGWVYQYWQSDKKDEVNVSERKIGGADIGPVTQLFTENYMVRFLLENSLGAWWATRHPESPLLLDWEFLRFDGEGAPAAGSFDGWPETVAEVTVMDPCCGSGHFLVEAFSMLWQMRAEEESLGDLQAQDAVLRDNLFGLELDPRCVQIAMFAVALTAWKSGGGWRELPTPKIACSGIPVKASVEEWKALAGGDERLENALVRLHILFRDADTLGSLIDPKRAVEIADPASLQTSFDDVHWDDIAPLLAAALTSESDDPANAVLGAVVAGVALAADFLSRHYTLVVTNVPYLTAKKQSSPLRSYVERYWGSGWADLATAFVLRSTAMSTGTTALVTPQNWLTLSSYTNLRNEVMDSHAVRGLVGLGAGAFGAISGEVVKAILLLIAPRASGDQIFMLDAEGASGPAAKAEFLTSGTLQYRMQSSQVANPDHRILIGDLPDYPLMSVLADSLAGIQTGDTARFVRYFWEVTATSWDRLQSTVGATQPFGGRENVVRRSGPEGLEAFANFNRTDLVKYRTTVRENRGSEAWGQRGIAVSLLGDLRSTLYSGDYFDNNVAVISPKRQTDLPAIWMYCQSPAFATFVRVLDNKMNVTNRTLEKVPFDLDYWRAEADRFYPNGLPEPWSDDPTQWLFGGRPEVATEPLQVAVGRLLGYAWPEQAESDDLDELADDDGIVCLPSVVGERPAADRLGELLAHAFGDAWSAGSVGELLADSGSKKDLESWLRDDFFKQHCQVFKNRPFVWHIWDGRKDGFVALVNYHRLDRATLERLTYSYVGDWIERQQAAVSDGVAGADVRLAAAEKLQGKLVLILEGEQPFDVYVRWKELHDQPMGWDPDINDGVRLNVRPFVEAGVLRHKFNADWKKDRGKNPDGSERHNDLHYTIAEKQAARPGTT